MPTSPATPIFRHSIKIIGRRSAASGTNRMKRIPTPARFWCTTGNRRHDAVRGFLVADDLAGTGGGGGTFDTGRPCREFGFFTALRARQDAAGLRRPDLRYHQPLDRPLAARKGRPTCDAWHVRRLRLRHPDG